MNVANRSHERLSLPDGLARATAPLAEHSRRRVRSAIERSRAAPRPGEAREGLIASVEAALFARLNAASARTLVLHLGAASERGLLLGETSEARFAFFSECLADTEFSGALLGQHPTLEARLRRLARLWEAATLETLRRLETTGEALGRELLGGRLAPWTATTSLGDPHRGGRTVQRLVFEDGREAIYKPRPIDMERGFQSFVRWLNDAGFAPELAAVEALAFGNWGWAKVVEAKPCADLAGVQRYFRRQGANLALAYLLGAVDLHFENVIASGEHPILVDLETLFHPFPASPGRRGASRVAGAALDDSVLRTLLLPVVVEDEPDAEGERRRTDPSALGYEGAIEGMAYVAEGWEAEGADSMRLGKVAAAMPAATCLPELDGKRVPAQGFSGEIVGGFSDAYDFLSRRREALLSETGPLEGFRRGLARRVLRPTASYVRLLEQSWHPRLSQDERLLETWLEGRLAALPPASPLPARRVRAEIAALKQGDVPYFLRRTGSDGPWRAHRARIAELSPVDKARQAWIARTCLASFEASLPAPAVRTSDAPVKAAIERAARAVGDQLCHLAFLDGRGASWLFPNVESAERLAPATTGFDLYDGLAGIGLFLTGLAARTGEARFEEMSRKAFFEARSIWRGLPRERALIGGYDGAGGLAWALAVAGRLSGRRAWRRVWLGAAVEVVEAHAPLAVSDAALDLIAGRAGLLLAGVGVARMAGRPELLQMLKPTVASLRKAELPPMREAGLAHGRAGIGFAVARAGGRAGEALIEADIEAARRVREGIEPAEVEHDGRRMLAWCRGGAGAALAAMRLARTPTAETETVVTSIRETYEAGELGAPLGYCHGAFGLIEILDEARDAGVRDAAEVAARLRRETLTRVLDGDVCTETYHRIEAPGMMRGLAGTGWALLRELEPGRFPSVLTLEAV
jgi:type 2 lantibiotic biosynthesis protein LanM